MRAKLERLLPAYVSARRWYRTKTKAIQAARITAAFPFRWSLGEAPQTARVLLVELALEDGALETYVLPLAFVTGELATEIKAGRPHAVVLPLEVRGRDRARALQGLVVDALAVEGFLTAWFDAATRGEEIAEAGLLLRFHPLALLHEGGSGRRLPARTVDGEQTNSSILYGDHFVGKVVRKLDPGESPDLEMGRFLTSAGYAHTPALAGWIDVCATDATGRAAPEATSTVGLLHAFAPNQGDAWKHALGALDGWLAQAARRDSAPPALSGDLLSRAMRPLPPPVRDAVGEYAELAELLGQRVGEMHVALATPTEEPAFRAEPLDAATRERVAGAVRNALEQALGHLERQAKGALREAFTDMEGRRQALESRLAAAVRSAEGGVRTRVHGDLHLGQVLFTGSDFTLIDFEGEPARPLTERKAKRSPLVDVAGMLRSFQYAVVSAVRARPESERAAVAPWAALWHRAVTAAFLRGWVRAVHGTVALPPSPAVTRSLLELFLLEKSVYELAYELDNRPDWAEIPLVGIRELLESEAAEGADDAWPEPPRADAEPGAVEASAIDPRSPAVAAFAEGTATHAHALLGAHPREDGTADFAVWAPNADQVEVVGDFNGWSGSPLARIEGTGIFAARVHGAGVGHRYKYRLVAHGTARDKADPYGYASEGPPGNASVVAELGHEWQDAGWMEGRTHAATLDRPMSIYEVHLGSWRRVVEEGGRSMTYREIAEPLAAHVKAMGFTHVELMPVLEHPFYGSWGYGVTGFFAPTSRYGSAADLMFLVDTLHQAGIGVIFDWVPAHFSRDEHGLAAFDGNAVFEPREQWRAVHPTWNTGLFDYARPEVRSFLLSSATFWIERFHADGLRIDGVESILYRDHQRPAGTWTPNEHGGRESLEGIAFLRQLTNTLKLQHPEVILAAEDSSAWPGVTRAASQGGLGFDLKWDMGFSHDMRRYLALDPRDRPAHQGQLTFRSVYAPNESFVIPLSHDDVVAERGGSLLQQMNGDAWQKLANLRLLYAMAWAQPGKKLLFMGSEIAQWNPWDHDTSLDWHLGQQREHEGIARLVGDLNRLYRETPALQVDAAAAGFEWVDPSSSAMSVITFLRKGAAPDQLVVVACNFLPVPRPQFRIGVPRGGHYTELFNSDAVHYGGSGHGNLGGVDAVPYPWNGRASSIVVTLPPLGIVMLALS